VWAGAPRKTRFLMGLGAGGGYAPELASEKT
jgi:hypothetical protein